MTLRSLRAADRVALAWRNGGAVTRQIATDGSEPFGGGAERGDWLTRKQPDTDLPAPTPDTTSANDPPAITLPQLAQERIIHRDQISSRDPASPT
jgi:hypothetical protein